MSASRLPSFRCGGMHSKHREVISEAIFTWMRPSLRLAAVIPQGVAGVFAVLYLLGAVAFGVALLFYTFSR